MDTVTLILSGLFTLALLIMISPSIFRINKGKILKSTALWLAIFLALGIAYQTIGPGKDAPLMPPSEEAVPNQDAPPHPLDNRDSLTPRT